VKPFTVHADAVAELHQALDHYESRQAGLGREFRVEFEAALGKIR
jgi:hypothetical protein